MRVSAQSGAERPSRVSVEGRFDYGSSASSEPPLSANKLMNTFLLYGSYGYTGQLILDLAVQNGLRPLLAGRDEARLKAQAGQYGLDYRVISLDNSAALDSALREVDAVLHCAGPFVLTFRQMAEACLRTRRHYVDISGEIEGFEALAALDSEARAAGIMMLPGAGFDVVPTDCLDRKSVV